MTEYKITIKGEKDSLTITTLKTEKGAVGYAKRLANEAFYGQHVQITIEKVIREATGQ